MTTKELSILTGLTRSWIGIYAGKHGIGKKVDRQWEFTEEDGDKLLAIYHDNMQRKAKGGMDSDRYYEGLF